ncbi:MAG TPA: choice-of-anchor P family protein [Candidatus Acidoferrales bacterium]|nr:choice-of-anchor P family protein [Candidatus Acidoferrales bacterium]
MKKILTAVAVAAGLTLQACSGHSFTPSTPYASGADLQQAQGAPALTAEPQAASGDFLGFADGLAYAEYTTQSVKGQTKVVSGPLAETPLECGTKSGTQTSSLPTLSSPYVESKTVDDNYTTTVAKGQTTVDATSTISNVSVLKGLITASSVKAAAETTATTKSQTSTTDKSTFTDLVVAGKHFSGTPKANTTITLNGYGYVILNQVPASADKAPAATSQSSALVNMIYVVVDIAGNPLKVPAGTAIVVGSASTAFTVPPAPYVVSPSSYSLYADGYGGSLSNVTGPWSNASVACNTNSDSKTEPGAKTPVGTVGSMSDNATSSASKNDTTADAESTTASASLLNGLIVASNVQVSVDTKRVGTKFTIVPSVKFGSLKIDGKTIASPVKANTKIVIKNLGYIMVNEQYPITANGSVSDQVNAVDLYVTSKKNTYNMASGGKVVLGHAAAAITNM